MDINGAQYPTYQQYGYPTTGMPPAGGVGSVMGPSMPTDQYYGVQAPPPGSGLNAFSGGGGGGLFGMIGGLLSSVLNLVKSVVVGVINLAMSVVTAIVKPILGLFGIGNKGPQGQASAGPLPGGMPAQMPQFNPANEAILRTADQNLTEYRSILAAVDSGKLDAKTIDWYAMMTKAETDFRAQRDALAKAYGPSSPNLKSFDDQCQQIMTSMRTYAGSAGNRPAAAAAGDLSGMTVSDGRKALEIQQYLAILQQTAGKAGSLSAADRSAVDQAFGQASQAIDQLRSSDPQMATALGQLLAKYQADWTAAKAAVPAPAASSGATVGGTNPAATGNGAQPGAARRYRDVPLDLPGDSPAPTTVPDALGGS